MARRRRGFHRPPLLDTGLETTLDADALWRAAEGLEEAFDYDGAHRHYREAVRRESGAAVLPRLRDYTRFLVERYGQFPEVAAWLDDADFSPAEDAPLGALVAQAALEAGHPRAEQLDERLASEHGQVESVSRVADRWLAAGRVADARALLERHATRLPALSRGAALLRQLRLEEDAACEAALAPVEQALSERDADAARAALAQAAPTWAEQARFKAMAVRVAEATLTWRSETLRAAIEAALDGDRLDDALAAASEVAELNPDNDSDLATLAALTRQAEARDLGAALERAAALAGQDRLAALIEVHASHGADAEVPEALAPAWRLVCAAFRALPEDVVRRGAASLHAVAQLRDALEAGDLDRVREGLDQLGGRWREIDTARRARARLAAVEAAEAAAEDTAAAAQIRAALADDDEAGARAALASRPRAAWHDAALLRELRREVEELELRAAQRERLTRELDAALAAGQLFAARRALATLGGLDSRGATLAGDRAGLLDERCASELRGAPVPPFGLSVGEGPVATAVVDGRLLIVQERLWLSVNLATRGLSPFQLPEGFPLAKSPAPRLGARAGRARLLGISQGRLVAIEQQAGAPPEVVQARPLSDYTRGPGQVFSWGLEPDADLLSLLVRRADGASTLVRVDADTLEPVSAERTRPALASVAGIAGTAEGLLAATEVDARARRGWAVGRFGASARPSATWSQDEVAEPIAGFRRAVAWPEQERTYAAYDTFDLFDASKRVQQPSLFVLRAGRIVFASSDLRRRFAPTAKIVIDHAWALDPTAGRLWFAALPREDHEGDDAMLLGVNARTLRPDEPVAIPGAQRVLGIHAVPEGAVALVRDHEGKHVAALAEVDPRGQISLTLAPLPV